MAGNDSPMRIGNRRNSCGTCNRFAQGVRRETLKELLKRHPEEALELRLRAELTLYPRLIKSFSAEYGIEDDDGPSE